MARVGAAGAGVTTELITGGGVTGLWVLFGTAVTGGGSWTEDVEVGVVSVCVGANIK